MGAKAPKERERYVLRMKDGTVVEVEREVYLEWYQSRRREKYQEEQKRKKNVCSLDRLEEHGALTIGDSLEEEVHRNMCREKVQAALHRLPFSDARLIQLLFFSGLSVTETARLLGCSRNTVRNRRDRILQYLKGVMKEMGIEDGCF